MHDDITYRVGVNEDDAVALRLEGLASLGARVVELARLHHNERQAGLAVLVAKSNSQASSGSIGCC
eukprot:9466075-Pyramimonas_sp.AAC.1